MNTNKNPIHRTEASKRPLQQDKQRRELGLLLALALLAAIPAALAQLPADARGKAQVFTCEGAPLAVAVEKDAIVLDYQWSRVTVDRATLAVKSRVTRTEAFRAGESIGDAMRRNDVRHWNNGALVGPGVSDAWFGNNQSKPSHVEVASVTNGEVTWRAMQPSDALKVHGREPEWTSWTRILQRVGAASYLERNAGGQTTHSLGSRDCRATWSRTWPWPAASCGPGAWMSITTKQRHGLRAGCAFLTRRKGDGGKRRPLRIAGFVSSPACKPSAMTFTCYIARARGWRATKLTTA